MAKKNMKTQIYGFIKKVEAPSTVLVLLGSVATIIGMANPVESLVQGSLATGLVLTSFGGALMRMNILK